MLDSGAEEPQGPGVIPASILGFKAEVVSQEKEIKWAQVRNEKVKVSLIHTI